MLAQVAPCSKTDVWAQNSCHVLLWFITWLVFSCRPGKRAGSPWAATSLPGYHRFHMENIYCAKKTGLRVRYATIFFQRTVSIVSLSWDQLRLCVTCLLRVLWKEVVRNRIEGHEECFDAPWAGSFQTLVLDTRGTAYIGFIKCKRKHGFNSWNSTTQPCFGSFVWCQKMLCL